MPKNAWHDGDVERDRRDGGQPVGMGERMRAVVQDGYGSPDRLRLTEVDRPEPGEDEVLVRVLASSVHPDVWHVVSGRPFVLRLMGSGLRMLGRMTLPAVRDTAAD
jgi:hypothetical protein